MEYKRNVRRIEITLLYTFIIMAGCVEIMKSDHAVRFDPNTQIYYFPTHFPYMFILL